MKNNVDNDLDLNDLNDYT